MVVGGIKDQYALSGSKKLSISDIIKNTQFHCSFDTYDTNGYPCQVPSGLKVFTNNDRLSPGLVGNSVNQTGNTGMSTGASNALQLFDENGDKPFIYSFYLNPTDFNTRQDLIDDIKFNERNTYTIRLMSGNIFIGLYTELFEKRIDGYFKISDIASLNQFNSIMLSYNASLTDPQFIAYVNGEEVPFTLANRRQYTGMNNDGDHSINTHIGHRFVFGSNPYIGKLDELNLATGIWELNDEIAQAHWNNGNGIQLFN